MKKIYKIAILSIIFFLAGFAFSVSAEETATSTDSGQATSTPVIVLETATSTPSVDANEATSTPEITPTPTPPPPSVEPVVPPSEPVPQSVPSPVESSTPPSPSQPPQSVVEPIVPFVSQGGRAFDPAIAPSKVTIRVIMPDTSPPLFPVFVTFMGVGNRNFGGKINANGELTAILPSDRYNTDLLVISTDYVQGEDGPAFFLEANEQRDLGVIRLMPKSQQTSQQLEDKTLEANILKEAESATGVGKILFLIVKLLMQILEEIRVIAGKLG